ncbi:hypothetical protein RRG08_033080 [Elysia crispata]|uniref:Amine oxidase n=1 Tax=Elysia crispata TaxID=231223 RepID=A0AAE1A6Z6_9GAST|nr:hypothetical protein RRG08_033080 [Elysia crispata]
MAKNICLGFETDHFNFKRGSWIWTIYKKGLEEETVFHWLKQDSTQTIMKRSARPIKLNPKYFDGDFKSTKLDLAVKNEPLIDEIEIDVDISEAVKAEPMEISAASKPSTDNPSVRPARQIKHTSRYLEGIGMLSSSSVTKADVKPEAVESVTNSPDQRPARQTKLNPKYEDGHSSMLSVAKMESDIVDSTSVPAVSRRNREIAKSKRRPPKQIRPSVKYWDLESTDDENPKRPCERSNCPAVAPICFAGISERCTGNKYTSRWYHISAGEHYCNDCFEYLRGRRGFSGDQDRGPKDYEAWRALWSSKAQRNASVSGYLVDQVLPFWARCQTCGKWRQLPRGFQVTPNIQSSFTCTVLAMCGNKVKQKDKDTDACDTLEDKRVQYVCSSNEFFPSRPSPSLRQSVAAPFLTKYYPDGIGLSPTELVQPISKAEKKKLCPYVVPFAKENRPLHALGVTPDMMLEQEIAEFPDLAQDCPHLYLALRNLVLAIWALNPKEWVTKEKVEIHIICRGLVRISCVTFLPRLLTFLTRHGYINQGLLTPPRSAVIPDDCQCSVIVVGGGASGLAAARCLHSYGIKVTVLEAKSCVGGRVSVSTESEVDTHSGQLLNGCWNNPLAIMAYQSGINLEPQSDSCPLITSEGQLVPDDLDRRIEFHYNAILDIVSDWRKGRDARDDVPLIDKFKEFHEEFIRETQEYFSEAAFSQQEVRRLVNFYLSNLEFACGCSLDQASSLYWDQNEDLLQLGGPHMRVSGGFGLLLKSLAQDLDITLDCQVEEVIYEDKNVVVRSNQGDFTADKVIVTVPLTVLKKGVPKFQPPLPEFKLEAIQSLGAGQVEKVTLLFSEDFWSEKINQRALFGQVPESEDHMGFFNVFYSHYCQESGSYFLMSHLVGKGLALMEGKTDEEIVDACLQVLQSLFPEKKIPQPQTSIVSHWTQDPYTGMAYSYIPVGASGQTYDDMAHTVDSRLHFAGEATHRQFPQTVTGAYISGMREAWKILDSLLNK